MPAKYHITTRPQAPRHKIVGKYGIVDWREDCSACHNCVKRECVYQVYNKERNRLQGKEPTSERPSGTSEYVNYLYECKGCLCCVQSCTKGLLSWDTNPEYLTLGDEVWTPDIISSTWFQAETGNIPVSGAGYPGPFRGPGFDSILTDMSEIVRPTRDGIHGREYISTSVDIGRKPMNLQFEAGGALTTKCPPLVELPLPLIFNMMPWHAPSVQLTSAILGAARRLGTLAITNEPPLMSNASAIPHIPRQGADSPAVSARMAQWTDSPDVLERIRKVKAIHPGLVAIVRLKLDSGNIDRAVDLAQQGADGLHLYADWHGYTSEPTPQDHPQNSFPDAQRHISMELREVHRALVREGIRDEITLIASGGISMAEHVIKTILCGADLVAIDVPLMIALECRVCQKCRRGLACPIDINSLDSDYAVQRIVNLMGAWHSQMLEMMGAMGIREARRLRGEVGRAMFFDDLERDCFGPVFGKHKAEVS